jgi:hypothetical protein
MKFRSLLPLSLLTSRSSSSYSVKPRRDLHNYVRKKSVSMKASQLSRRRNSSSKSLRKLRMEEVTKGRSQVREVSGLLLHHSPHRLTRRKKERSSITMW